MRLKMLPPARLALACSATFSIEPVSGGVARKRALSLSCHLPAAHQVAWSGSARRPPAGRPLICFRAAASRAESSSPRCCLCAPLCATRFSLRTHSRWRCSTLSHSIRCVWRLYFSRHRSTPGNSFGACLPHWRITTGPENERCKMRQTHNEQPLSKARVAALHDNSHLNKQTMRAHSQCATLSRLARSGRRQPLAAAGLLGEPSGGTRRTVCADNSRIQLEQLVLCAGL